MKTVAFYNVKGGVGKTTSAVNIASLAAKSGVKTILWDLDAQSCASWYLGVDDSSQHKILRVFKGKTPLGRLRISTACDHLEVIPADLSLRKLEAMLSEVNNRKLLEQLAAHLSENHQLLIFDCSPTFSKLSENIFSCSDLLVVPLIPSPLSIRAYEQLKDYVASKKQWKKLMLQPVFTMVDRRRKIHNEFIQQAGKLLGEKKVIVIPYASDVERMGVYRQPLDQYAPSSNAAKAYQDLWRQLSKKYQLS